MELTDEMIADSENCKHFETCHECAMPHSQIHTCIASLSRALQAERAKPKVWDGAPDDATKARVEYFSPKYATFTKGMEYTRMLPKTRAREIAEEIYNRYFEENGNPEDVRNFIESAILKREAELKA